MNRIINPLSILLITFCAYGQQEENRPLKSTITTVSSSTVALSSNKYTVLQSIGQSSIIGTVKTGKMVVQQGFLNSTRYFKLNNSGIENIDERLEIVVSPNPFVEYVKVDFSESTAHPIHLKVFDLNGKVLKYKKYSASDSVIIPMENIIIGSYILHIVSGEDTFARKILKVRE
ncbi:T9SS type A sorting domain-containing protein [Urechidicola vernalis]|uniref:T9SS type A sorting domain-containing protein n=1 Tax=Urechidicola vernalis TaxID=3075600 RepID=A0ABU2Y8B4_9FLAO|nr:T9SS type A sorting domain-containing protein [Urechidicola sp. P050]MDT0554277.1 T9SS type A sorting domain-containing protein [Urechidicola sp. P050]